MWKKFWADERGVTAIEYVVIAASMGMAIILIMPQFGSQIATQFTSLASHIGTGK